jgi:hypothetical protein
MSLVIKMNAMITESKLGQHGTIKGTIKLVAEAATKQKTD